MFRMFYFRSCSRILFSGSRQSRESHVKDEQVKAAVEEIICLSTWTKLSQSFISQQSSVDYLSFGLVYDTALLLIASIHHIFLIL